MKVRILITLSFLAVVLIGATFFNFAKPENVGSRSTQEPITEITTPHETEEAESQASTTSTIPSYSSNMSPNTPVVITPQPEAETEPITEPVTITPINEPRTMAWIYPSEPGCNARAEYKDGRKIDVLKPEFFTINGGTLQLLDTNNSSCNGYSKSFIADLKQYSNEQYVTVSSASATDMDTFLNSALATNKDLETLVTFVVENNLTGIELDFEDFGSWSQITYQKYLAFVKQLGTELHNNNKKLMLDGPAIANSTEQRWFTWKYEDFISLPVDQIVVMAYDYQFDHGTGQPVAPLSWMKEVTKWASDRYPQNKLTVGVPSYGYEGVVGKRPFIRTHTQLKNKPGFTTAVRDSDSGEMTWQSGNTVYFYQDKESIRQKIKAVTEMGISSVSIWHLGGNVWYK